jgi:hypothetical protein
VIGMKLTAAKTLELKPPGGASAAQELVSEKKVKLGHPLAIQPRSTVVLWLGN